MLVCKSNSTGTQINNCTHFHTYTWKSAPDVCSGLSGNPRCDYQVHARDICKSDCLWFMCSLKQFLRPAIFKSPMCNSLGLLTTGSQIINTRMHHCLRFVHQVITTQKNLPVRSADQMHRLPFTHSLTHTRTHTHTHTHTHTQWQRWEWMDQASNSKIPFVLITNWTVTEHCKSKQQAKKPTKKPFIVTTATSISKHQPQQWQCFDS